MAIGIKTNGLEEYTQIKIVPIVPKNPTIKAPTANAIYVSNTVISLENLFKILPKGTLSKNSLRGAYNKQVTMYLCIFLIVLKLQSKIVEILSNVPKDIPIEVIVKIIK